MSESEQACRCCTSSRSPSRFFAPLARRNSHTYFDLPPRRFAIAVAKNEQNMERPNYSYVRVFIYYN